MTVSNIASRPISVQSLSALSSTDRIFPRSVSGTKGTRVSQPDIVSSPARQKAPFASIAAANNQSPPAAPLKAAAAPRRPPRCGRRLIPVKHFFSVSPAQWPRGGGGGGGRPPAARASNAACPTATGSLFLPASGPVPAEADFRSAV